MKDIPIRLVESAITHESDGCGGERAVQLYTLEYKSDDGKWHEVPVVTSKGKLVKGCTNYIRLE